jgi:hypothetical protein
MTLKLLRMVPLMMTLAAPALAGDATADAHDKDAHAKEHAKEHTKEHAKKAEPKKDADKKAPAQDNKAK